ncbi:MAG: DUF885 family protein [Deltaproteobacteria bacterium]|nr:MAG: DUF885 family protein [Deltaproteobacteria bacterium]
MLVDRLSVENTGAKIFETVAGNFPLASASDEFYFFPQVQSNRSKRKRWDSFTEDTISDVIKKLAVNVRKLDILTPKDSESELTDLETRIDLSLLKRITRTLIEQLTEVRAWETQPTWHLTIACVGMAQAMGSRDPAAKHEQAKELPVFFDQAGLALRQVPVLFRELGLEMVAATREYLVLLEQRVPEVKAALVALDRFEEKVRQVTTRSNFLLPVELLERIVRFHLNCNASLQDMNQELDQEIQEMQVTIRDLIGSSTSDLCRSKAFDKIPLPEADSNGLLGVYRKEVRRLAEHCLANELVSRDIYHACPVRVEPVPSFLSAIRTASSYSISPRYPPTGGVFYVINANDPAEARKGYQREYRILSAHETYPGHHLLDSLRWSLKRPIRRGIEQPLYYEGWACFAEEIMHQTGYFTTSSDRLLLARRRLWRAIRGKVDLGLQTGAMDLKMAASYLSKAGIRIKDAISAARKYTLNPGYQLCYTIGLRRFLDLFQRYGQQNLKDFVAVVLSQGEIDFQDLNLILKQAFGDHS